MKILNNYYVYANLKIAHKGNKAKRAWGSPHALLKLFQAHFFVILHSSRMYGCA